MGKSFRKKAILLLLLVLAGANCFLIAAEIPSSHGLVARPPAAAFLQMPTTSAGNFPKRLSQTGAFKDLPNLIPTDGLIPYDLVVPFWSDGAPEIAPRGGNFSKLVTVELKNKPGAKIFYTLDGTVPTENDLLYEKPIQISSPTILRAKAFKVGFTKSITSQEIFLIGG